jgi:hypothetical protein
LMGSTVEFTLAIEMLPLLICLSPSSIKRIEDGTPETYL